MNRTYYMGSFPPPYGGVTLKNELLYGLLKDKTEMRVKQKFTVLSTIEALLLGNRFILAVGHTKFLLLLTTAMALLRPKAMRKSVVFAMGGNLADLVEGHPKLIERLGRYRHIFVEPQGMLRRLQAMGLQNVSLMPNCRVRPKVDYPPTETSGTLRCIFFSRIMLEKGVDSILEAAAMLPEVEVDFYGPIEPSYEESFSRKIDATSNAKYKGLFKERDEALYQMLHSYDVMLLPTKWAFEGVPGALVESKIATIPAIVSDICYNAEIVADGVSGIVLKENTVHALAEAIDRLDKHRQLLYALKCGAKQSAESYYIENYMDEIMEMLEIRT